MLILLIESFIQEESYDDSGMGKMCRVLFIAQKTGTGIAFKEARILI